MSGATWTIDLHRDPRTRAVRMSVVDTTARLVYIESLDILTVASVRDGLWRIVARYGMPSMILTEDSTIFAGLGEAIGVVQRHPSQAGHPAWLERMLAWAAA